MSKLGWLRSLAKHVDAPEDSQQSPLSPPSQQQQRPRSHSQGKSGQPALPPQSLLIQQQPLSTQQESSQPTLPAIQSSQAKSSWLSNFRPGKSSKNADEGSPCGDNARANSRVSAGGSAHSVGQSSGSGTSSKSRSLAGSPASASPASASPAVTRATQQHHVHVSPLSNAATVISAPSTSSIVSGSTSPSSPTTEMPQQHMRSVTSSSVRSNKNTINTENQNSNIVAKDTVKPSSRLYEQALRDAGQILAATSDSPATPSGRSRAPSDKTGRLKHDQLPKIKIDAGANNSDPPGFVSIAASNSAGGSGTSFNSIGSNSSASGLQSSAGKSPLSAISSATPRSPLNTSADGFFPGQAPKKSETIGSMGHSRNKSPKALMTYNLLNEANGDAPPLSAPISQQPHFQAILQNLPQRAKDPAHISPAAPSSVNDSEGNIPHPPSQAHHSIQSQSSNPSHNNPENASYKRQGPRPRRGSVIVHANIGSSDDMHARRGSMNANDTSESIMSPPQPGTIHRLRISAAERPSGLPGPTSPDDASRPKLTRMSSIRSAAHNSQQPTENTPSPSQPSSGRISHHLAIDVETPGSARPLPRRITTHTSNNNVGIVDSHASIDKSNPSVTASSTETPVLRTQRVRRASISVASHVLHTDILGSPKHAARRGSLMQRPSVLIDSSSIEDDNYATSNGSMAPIGVNRLVSTEGSGDSRQGKEQSSNGVLNRAQGENSSHSSQNPEQKDAEASKQAHVRSNSSSRLAVAGHDDGGDVFGGSGASLTPSLAQRRKSISVSPHHEIQNRQDGQISRSGSRFFENEPELFLSPPTEYRPLSRSNSIRQRSSSSIHFLTDGGKNKNGSSVSLNQDQSAQSSSNTGKTMTPVPPSTGAPPPAKERRQTGKELMNQSNMVEQVFSKTSRMTPKKMSEFIKDTESRHQNMLARIRDARAHAGGVHADNGISPSIQIDSVDKQSSENSSSGQDKSKTRLDADSTAALFQESGGIDGVTASHQSTASKSSAQAHRECKHRWIKLFRLFMIRRQLFVMYLAAMKFIPPIMAPTEADKIIENLKNSEQSKKLQAITDRVLSLLRERDAGGGLVTIDNLDLILSSQLRSFAKFSLAQRRKFCELMEYEKHRPGKLIVMENHFANCFYFVLSGKLEIFKGWDDAKYRLNVIGQGDSFGERTMAILNDKRTASITAIENVELLRVDKREYSKFAKQEQERLTSHISQIANIPLFVGKPEVVKKLVGCMQLLTFEPQQTIMREEAPNFQIIWILSGSCRCIKHVPFIKKRLAGNENNFVLQPYTSGKPVDPGEELVNELLAITELSVGDNFPALPVFPLPFDPNTHLQRFNRDHYISCLKDAPAVINNVTLVANSTVEIMMVSRVELCQLIDDDMIQYLLEDSNNITNIPLIKLQEAFLQRKQWDAYKKKIRSEVGNKKK